jgi:hypothetical protein
MLVLAKVPIVLDFGVMLRFVPIVHARIGVWTLKMYGYEVSVEKLRV